MKQYGEPVRDIAVKSLHVGRNLELLLENDILTCSDLLEKSASMQVNKKVVEVIKAVEHATDGQGFLNWEKYFEARGIELVPLTVTEKDSEEMFLLIPEIVKELIIKKSNERSWMIVQSRFGFNRRPKLTLQELGDAFNLSRERIRQIESKTLKLLRNYLIENKYSTEPFHTHPSVLELFTTFSNSVARLPDIGILEPQLFSLLNGSYKIDAGLLYPSITLIMTLFEFERVENANDKFPEIWCRLNSKKARDHLQSVISKIDHVLTRETVHSLDEITLLTKLNKLLPAKERISHSEISAYVNLCPSVETLEGNMFRGKFEYLVGRENQVERLLTEQGQPMKFRSLTREINSRLVKLGEKTLDVRNLTNQLVNSDRFEPIGKSGYWGLTTWEVDNRTIVEFMKEAINVENHPLKSQEIYEYVKNRRNVSLNSIKIYLLQNDTFQKLTHDTWILSGWSEAKLAKAWTTEEVTEFVNKFFLTRSDKEVEFNVLTKKLAELANLSPRQAAGKLKWTPALKTYRKSDKITAVFLPDYASEEKTTKKARRKTIRESVDELLPGVLTKDVQYQLPLSDVIKSIQKEIRTPRHTLYQYLSESKLVEYKEGSGSDTKICILTQPKGNDSLPEVNNIHDFHTRDKVERALSFLTEENVDIALSLLSKEFENSLKHYLVHAAEQGQLNDTPKGDPQRWKLFDLVDCAFANRIIDSAEDLHYLRQIRNQRAHGSTPTKSERVSLMSRGPHIAGLYVHYIAHFANLSLTLNSNP